MRGKGYEYFAMTDHSKALAMTGGLDAKRLRKQWEEIEEIQSRHPEIRILRSQEVDILADGSLDLEDEMLERVGSGGGVGPLPIRSAGRRADPAHSARHPASPGRYPGPSHRTVDQQAATVRIRPRDPCSKAPERNVVRRAQCPSRAPGPQGQPPHVEPESWGCEVAISTDAHRVQHLDLMRYGVEQARRAWLGPKTSSTPCPLEEFAAGHRKVDASSRRPGGPSRRALRSPGNGCRA